MRTARAKKEADNDREVDPTPYPEEDTGDEDTDGDDTPTDGEPDDGERRKKGKKAAEPKDTCDDQDETTVSAFRALHPGNYGAAVKASDDAVIAAEIKAGLPMTAAQVLYCGRVRRGEVADLSLVPRGNDPIAQTARQILNAGCRRRGEKERF